MRYRRCHESAMNGKCRHVKPLCCHKKRFDKLPSLDQGQQLPSLDASPPYLLFLEGTMSYYEKRNHSKTA
jgi:hypothetical protein